MSIWSPAIVRFASAASIAALTLTTAPARAVETTAPDSPAASVDAAFAAAESHAAVATTTTAPAESQAAMVGPKTAHPTAARHLSRYYYRSSRRFFLVVGVAY
jgi:hypothetical protein